MCIRDSIRNAALADLTPIFRAAPIRKILLNGALAYKLFVSKYEDTDIPYFRMPSTSPATPRFDKSAWEEQLRDLL